MVLWDGLPWKEVCKSLFIKDLINFPNCQSKQEFEQQFICLEKKIAKKYLLYLLSKRGFFSAELEAKLLSKGFSPRIVQAAIEDCCQKGFLDDAQRMDHLMARELERGKSIRAICFKLSQKKIISNSQRCDYLHQAAAFDQKALQKWLQKNNGRIKWNHPLERKKLIAKLYRRGFSLELILENLPSH